MLSIGTEQQKRPKAYLYTSRIWLYSQTHSPFHLIRSLRCPLRAKFLSKISCLHRNFRGYLHTITTPNFHSLLRPIRADSRRGDLAFNAALILATKDTKITIFAPVRVPGVRHFPICNAVFGAPAYDTNSMTPLIAASYVLVWRNFVFQGMFRRTRRRERRKK